MDIDLHSRMFEVKQKDFKRIIDIRTRLAYQTEEFRNHAYQIASLLPSEKVSNNERGYHDRMLQQLSERAPYRMENSAEMMEELSRQKGVKKLTLGEASRLIVTNLYFSYLFPNYPARKAGKPNSNPQSVLGAAELLVKSLKKKAKTEQEKVDLDDWLLLLNVLALELQETLVDYKTSVEDLTNQVRRYNISRRS